MQNTIKTVLFDFGGVLAAEGFREGLHVIGKRNGLDPDEFFATVDALIYGTGYLTGSAGEAAFWNAVRSRTGISEDDASLREEILRRFVIRPQVLSYADLLRARKIIVALLSDQTNWLEEIDQRTSLFRHFDRVFNSYRTHKSKRDASVFPDVCSALGVKREETLFIDDTIDHISRAQSQGLLTIHYVSIDDFDRRLRAFFPDLRSSCDNKKRERQKEEL